MKKNTLMAAVSVVALLAAGAASAETRSSVNAETRASATSNDSLREDMREGWNDTKAAAKETYRDAKAGTKEAYREMKAAMIGREDSQSLSAVNINLAQTAEGIIGKPVHNQSNERIATVEDIIIDRDGNANLVVVRDGGFLGMGGKLAAFDYGSIVSRTADGDVVMPVSQQTLDRVATFSYDANEASNEGTRMIPAGGFSVKELLDGNIVASNGAKVGHIENLAFRNGMATLVVGEHDELLKVGDDKIAVDFDSATLVRNGDSINVRLNTAQTANLERAKR